MLKKISKLPKATNRLYGYLREKSIENILYPPRIKILNEKNNLLLSFPMITERELYYFLKISHLTSLLHNK